MYSGRWYEIARYPNPFEMNCSAATADYIPDSQGLIVVNTCYQKDGTWYQNIGRAQPSGQGLEVNFTYVLSLNQGGIIPSSPGNYRVLWTDYQNFSFVAGGPYYWILSRRPIIDRHEQVDLIRKTLELGYNPNRLIWNKPRPDRT